MTTLVEKEYRYDDDAPFSALLGRTLQRVDGLEKGSERVTFVCDNGEAFTMFHRQDCCEHVSVEDVVGEVSYLIGSPITMADESSKSGDNKDGYGTETWTFYKLATVKGYVDIRWYGSSNGYYSESVTFYQSAVLEGFPSNTTGHGKNT